MSERYSKVFSLPENLYAEGAPVVIAAGALLKDNQTGRVVAQLKLRNISPKTIKAATVCLFPANIVGNPLGDAVRYEYLDLSSTRDADFGSKSAIPMPDKTIRSFSVRVAEVIFADNSVWSNSNVIWEPLEKPEALGSRLDSEMVKQFQIEYGSRAKNFLLEQKDLWYCVCGAVNHGEEKACHSCQKTLCDLRNIDLDTLEGRKERRLAKEREQAAQEAMAKQERERKVKKTLAIVLLVVAVVTALVLLLNNVIIPKAKYSKAVSLMKSGQYEEASALFEKLGDYKDASQMVFEVAYQKALALMDAENYEDAISAFEVLDGYRDSANLLVESRYQYALELMHQKDYEKAASIFAGLDDYADSKEIACECGYLRALELIGQEDYSGAHSVLRTIPEYKDAAEYLSHMYMVPQKITSTIDRGREDAFFYFGYNSDGKMNEAREVVGTSSWSFSFSEDGVLTDLYDLSGKRFEPYVTTSDGLVTSYDMSGEAYRYDEHGNLILIAGKCVEQTGRKYDEHGNRTDNSTNVYGAAGNHKEMNLQSVCRDDELMVQSNFSYTYLYSPNEDVDMDLIWKNVRIICSGWVWG